MARKPSQSAIIGQLLVSYGKLIRNAFLEAVAKVRSRVVLRQIVDALKQNDLGAAVEALHIEKAVFNPVLEQIRAAYVAGGENAVRQLPGTNGDGARLFFVFDARNPVAENTLNSYLFDLVTNVTQEQVDTMRSTFAEGLQQGMNPTQTALSVVGRINRATGRREGGVIGLTAPHAATVSRTREDLLSGDPARMSRIFNLKRRDKRLDAIVSRAIKDGTPVKRADVERIVGRLSDSYLKLRGDTIGRTETMTALNSASFEAIRQAKADGKLDGAVVEKQWHTHLDGRERHTHLLLNGQSQPVDSPFLSVSGAQLRYPGDPRAPGAERIDCRCWLAPKVDFLARFRK